MKLKKVSFHPWVIFHLCRIFVGATENPEAPWAFVANVTTRKSLTTRKPLTGPRIFPLFSLFFGAAFRPFYQLPRPSPTYWTCWNQPNRSSGSPSQHRLVGCTTHLVRCFMFWSLGFRDPKVINFALQSQNHPSHNPTNASADEFFLTGGKFGMHPRKQIFVNQPIHMKNNKKQKTWQTLNQSQGSKSKRRKCVTATKTERRKAPKPLKTLL